MNLATLREQLVTHLENNTNRRRSQRVWSGEPTDAEQDKVFRAVVESANTIAAQRAAQLWRAGGFVEYRTTINVLDEDATTTAAYTEMDQFVTALQNPTGAWSLEETEAKISADREDLVTRITFRVMVMEDDT